MASKEERGEIARRIEEAAETLKRLPDGDRGKLRLQTLEWPMLLRDATEHGAYKGLTVRMPPPSGKSIDQMNETFVWLLALAKHEVRFVKVLWLLYAEKRDVTYVGKLLACDRKTVRAWGGAGLDFIARLAHSKVA